MFLESRDQPLLTDFAHSTERYVELALNLHKHDPVSFSEAIGYTNNWHHEEWYDLAINPDIKNLLILGPRSHAKTECLGVNYPSMLIGSNRDIRILLVSNTSTQASALVRQIRLRMESDEKYRSLFGNLEEDSVLWSDEAILVKRSKIMKDPTVSGVGVLGPIIGRRADLIICDDVVDKENAATPTQRDKVESWFKEVLIPVLEPDGKMILIGSTYHYDDLYARLEKNPRFIVRKYKAIQKDGSPLWPERWPLNKLEEKRAEMGSILFNSQYQSDPSGLQGLFFKDEWLCYYDLVPQNLRIYQGVDVAIGDSPENDYFVIATVGKDQANNYYLLDILRGHLTFPDQIKAVLNQHQKWKPEKVGIESVAYQKSLSQAAYNVRPLPIIEVKTTKSKTERMAALTAYFESGHFHIKREMEAFRTEYLQFPKGEHDDQLDAVEFAVQTSYSAFQAWAFSG